MKFIIFFFVLFINGNNCERSSFIFNDELIRESGNYWFTARNICLFFYNRETHMNLYVNSDNEYNLLLKQLIYHKYSFNVLPEYYKGIPQRKLSDEEIWLTSSWLNDNIVHFLDNMFLYNIEGDNRYPPIKHLIMADYNPQSTLPYNNMMLKLMINNYKNPFKITFQPDLMKEFRKNDFTLCYKKVHIYVRSMNSYFPAVFRHYSRGRKYRDEGYKYLKIKVDDDDDKLKNSNDKIVITIVSRKIEGKARPRSIRNIEMIKSVIRSLGYEYNEIYYDNKTPKEQIELIMYSKLIVTPFGSGTMNIMWIFSEKVIVIDCMATYVMIDYSCFSYSLNYKYIPLFTLYHNIDPYSFDKESEKGYKFKDKPSIVSPVHRIGYTPLFKTSGDSMTISLRQILFSLKYSLTYLIN